MRPANVQRRTAPESQLSSATLARAFSVKIISGLASCLALRASDALNDICGVTGVPMLDASSLVNDRDECDPEGVALVIRNLLEATAGT